MHFLWLAILATASVQAFPSPRHLSPLLNRVQKHHRRAAAAQFGSSGVFPSSSAAPSLATATTQATNATLSAVSLAKKSSNVAATYYPDWNADAYPPESIDFSKLDLVYFAFAIPSSTYDLYFTQTDSESILRRLVKSAHKHNTKVVLSIGGWSGGVYYSNAVNGGARRRTFVRNIQSLVKRFNLDGVDIDWEYPNSDANPSNIIRSKDASNLAHFLKLLRAKLGKKKIISAAVSTEPWNGANGSPLKDVSAQAKYLDHIVIMNYDVWGASATPGPNAPLADGCGDSVQPNANAASAIANWKAAGMPAKKILLGLPAYGYVSASTATSLVHRRALDIESQIAAGQERRRLARRGVNPALALQDTKAPTLTRVHMANGKTVSFCPDNHGDNCGIPDLPTPVSQGVSVASSTASASAATSDTFSEATMSKTVGTGDLSAWVGSQIPFNTLLSAGALYKKSNGDYRGKNGYVRSWDKCSSTPFLRNAAQGIVVTYDGPESILLKARYAKGRSIGGFAFWDYSSDSNNALLDAARSGFKMS